MDLYKEFEYKSIGYTEDTNLQTMNNRVFWITIGAFISLLIGFIILAVFAVKLKDTYEFGKRSQQECGNNYIEMETARYKVFDVYNEKTIRLVKAFLQISLGIIVLTLFGIYLTYNEGWKSFDVLVPALILVGFYIGYFIVMIRHSTQSKYETKDIVKTNSFIGVTVTMMALVIIACLHIMLYLDNEKENKSSQISLVLFTSIIVFVLVIIVEIRTRQINDNFIEVYQQYQYQINDGIGNLRGNKGAKETIQNGPYKGKTVKEWMNIMLAQNINRENPTKQVKADTLSETMNNPKYKGTDWKYMEHRQGKELEYIPDENTVRGDLHKVRLNMQNIRNDNDSMLKPVKKFIREISLVMFLLIAIISFILYHFAYTRNPTMTKIVIIAALLFMVFWLMISIIL
jgi:hypothetical protein